VRVTQLPVSFNVHWRRSREHNTDIMPSNSGGIFVFAHNGRSVPSLCTVVAANEIWVCIMLMHIHVSLAIDVLRIRVYVTAVYY